MSATETKNMSADEKAAAKAKAAKKAEREAKKAARKAEREQERANRPAPVAFRTVVAAEHLNGDGLLTIANVADHGFNEETHEDLSRDDFASESLWLTFRASRLRARAAQMIAKAETLEQEAKGAAAFGDPSKRAAVKRIQKLAGAFAELKATLEKEGIDVSSLLGNLA